MRDPLAVMEAMLIDALAKRSGCSDFGEFLVKGLENGNSSARTEAADAIDADEGGQEPVPKVAAAPTD